MLRLITFFVFLTILISCGSIKAVDNESCSKELDLDKVTTFNDTIANFKFSYPESFTFKVYEDSNSKRYLAHDEYLSQFIDIKLRLKEDNLSIEKFAKDYIKTLPNYKAIERWDYIKNPVIGVPQVFCRFNLKNNIEEKGISLIEFFEVKDSNLVVIHQVVDNCDKRLNIETLSAFNDIRLN